MHTRLSIVLLKIAPALIAIAAVLTILGLFEQNQTVYSVKQTNAYTRVSNCILGKSAYTPVKQSDVEKCYQTVEKDAHIKLKRFDYDTAPQPKNN